jgi:hypothetical protein
MINHVIARMMPNSFEETAPNTGNLTLLFQAVIAGMLVLAGPANT